MSCTGSFTVSIAARKPSIQSIDEKVLPARFFVTEKKVSRSAVNDAFKNGEVVTFSDAFTAVRRWLWADGVFPQAFDDASVKKLPSPLRDFLLNRLAMAA